MCMIPWIHVVRIMSVSHIHPILVRPLVFYFLFFILYRWVGRGGSQSWHNVNAMKCRSSFRWWVVVSSWEVVVMTRMSGLSLARHWHGLVQQRPKYIHGRLLRWVSVFIRNVSHVEEWKRSSLCNWHTTLLCSVVQIWLRTVFMHIKSRWRCMCQFLVMNKCCRWGRRILWAIWCVMFDCPCIDCIVGWGFV